MSNSHYFKQAAEMKGQVAVTQQYYYELVAQFLKSKEIGIYKDQKKAAVSSEYNADHFHLDKLDRTIEQLKQIKDGITTLRSSLNHRPTLFKHGSLKKKLDAILTQEDVVQQLRALKALRTALDKVISTGLNNSMLDYLTGLDSTAIYKHVNPERDIAWKSSLRYHEGVDTTNLTLVDSGFRTA